MHFFLTNLISNVGKGARTSISTKTRFEFNLFFLQIQTNFIAETQNPFDFDFRSSRQCVLCSDIDVLINFVDLNVCTYHDSVM